MENNLERIKRFSEDISYIVYILSNQYKMPIKDAYLLTIELLYDYYNNYKEFFLHDSHEKHAKTIYEYYNNQKVLKLNKDNISNK